MRHMPEGGSKTLEFRSFVVSARVSEKLSHSVFTFTRWRSRIPQFSVKAGESCLPLQSVTMVTRDVKESVDAFCRRVLT